MQARCKPWRWLMLPNLEHSTSRLNFVPCAPSGNERVRERGVGKVDRHGIIEHPAHPGRRHGPPVRAAILVEPGGYLSMPLAETLWRNADPDADWENAVRPA
jgi:hypothetical protein